MASGIDLQIYFPLVPTHPSLSEGKIRCDVSSEIE